MPQDQKTIEKSERNRGDHEQVHRGNAVCMVGPERPPLGLKLTAGGLPAWRIRSISSLTASPRLARPW